MKKKGWKILTAGDGTRTPIKGTKEQYQAYQDSLDLYNKKEKEFADEKEFLNTYIGIENAQRGVFDKLKGREMKYSEGTYPLYALWHDKINPIGRRYMTASGLGEDRYINYDDVYYKKPVQPIIYQQEQTPEQIRNNPTNRNNPYITVKTDHNDLNEALMRGTNTSMNLGLGTNIDLRITDKPIQMSTMKGLLPSREDTNEINPIPFVQGSYFTRDRQNQELDSKQFGRKGKKDYFDKKTGKLLGTYKDGGKTPSWKIID